MKTDIIKAHDYCTDNKPMMQNGEKCGCFYCLNIFSANEIELWIKDIKGTARCPYCGIDSVISEASGLKTTKELLKEMNEYWFQGTRPFTDKGL